MQKGRYRPSVSFVAWCAMDGFAIAKHTKPLIYLRLNRHPFSQNSHDLIRASGGDGLTPKMGGKTMLKRMTATMFGNASTLNSLLYRTLYRLFIHMMSSYNCSEHRTFQLKG